MKEFWNRLRKGDFRGLLIEACDDPFIQLFRYCIVGGCAFLIDFGVYCLLKYLGMYYLVAAIFSFLISFAFNFLVSRVMIFKNAAQHTVVHKELFGVVAISVIGLGLTELLLFICTSLCGMDYRLSKIVASILVLLWNYAARKIFVYKAPKTAMPEDPEK